VAASQLQGAILTALHDAPVQPAQLQGATLTALHDVPPAPSQVQGIILYALHDSVPAPEVSVSCAAKPDSHFIVPDPLLVGAANVVSVTSEAGPYPGAASAEDDNLGRLLPVQAGRVTDDAVDVVYRLSEAGGVDTAEFLWRRQTETSSDFFGADDPRRFWGQHHPSVLAGAALSDPGASNSAIVYAEAFRRLVAFAVPNSGTAINIRTARVAYRDVDDDRYDEWTLGPLLVLARAPITGSHNLAAVELADGRLLVVVRIEPTGATPGDHDFDIYQSADGGLSWSRTASDIIARGGGGAPQTDSTSQIRLARSGEHLRLAWVETGSIHSAYSSDRGATWALTTDALAMGTSGTTDDPYPFDIVGVDEQGLFQLAWLFTATVDSLSAFYGRRDAAFAFTTAPSGGVLPGAIYQIVNVRTPSWLYVWILYDSGGSNLVWNFLRQRPEDADSTIVTDWQEAEPLSVHRAGMEYAPGRVQAAWTGSGVAFWGGSRDQATAYTDQIRGQFWYWGEWTKRSLGRHPSSRTYSTSDSPIWRDYWHCGLGFPSEHAGSVWTETIGGTGFKTSTREFLELGGLAAGDVAKYGSSSASGVWLAGSEFTWFVRLDTGDGSSVADDIVMEIEARNGTGSASIKVAVRHSAGALTLVDNEAAGAVLATMALPGLDSGSAGGFSEIRLWIYEDSTPAARVQLIAYDYTTDTWVVTPVVNPTRNTGAPAATSSMQFGHKGQTQVTPMTSWWREVSWTDENTSQQGGPNDDADPTGQVNPGGLFGWPTGASMVTRIEEGLSVLWAGSGGVRGDLFDGQIKHQHPADAIAIGSPRLDWRATKGTPAALTTSTLVLDASAGLAGGVDLWEHDAIAVFGTNVRTILVEYDTTTAFAAPTVAGTIDCTAFAATAYTVASVAGNVLQISGTPTRFTSGECEGLYVRMTSGVALGLTFKVTAHRALTVLHLGDETVALSLQGVAAADTFVLFHPHGSLTYAIPIGDSVTPAKQYLRLTCSDTDTAEDDHRLGSVVVGKKVPITVPLDWAHTNNQQPNITRYRTRGAIRWAFPEGPKQRTIVGRVVGDANRFRDRLRYVLGQIDFEARPVALVVDGDRPEEPILGRVVSGSQNDDAAWYRDTDGTLRTAGDLSITFEEEV
jgi:hypothetical protein